MNVQHPYTTWSPSTTRKVGSWSTLDISWYKINFDGATYENDNCAGLKVIIRNLTGFIMDSLSQLILLPFLVIEVKVLAARRALELAVEIGIDRIILERFRNFCSNIEDWCQASLSVWPSHKWYFVPCLTFHNFKVFSWT